MKMKHNNAADWESYHDFAASTAQFSAEFAMGVRNRKFRKQVSISSISESLAGQHRLTNFE